MNAPFEHLPPHSIESEQCVIGALLLDNTAYDRIADLLTAEAFYRDDHRRIYRHIAAQIEVGRNADVVTTYERIERSNEVDQTGGMAYLIEIANSTPSAANVRRYAEAVLEASRKRAIIAAAHEMMDAAYGPGQISEMSVPALGKLIDLCDGSGPRSEPKAAQHFIAKAVEEIEAIYGGAKKRGIQVGYTDLDERLGGLSPGDVVVLAGRPSMGKTALGMNIVESVILNGGKAMVFSLEMTGVQLSNRLLASIGQIELDRLMTGKMDNDDWSNMTKALGALHETDMVLDETAGLSIQQIHARARRESRRRKLDIILIDYLGLISAPKGQTINSKENEIAAISAGIKRMAKDLGVPVIVLSQLSRKVEERTNRRPMMSDLRDSGTIEQDADIIILMYRDEYYNPDSLDKGLAEANIAKHRNGKPGVVNLVFQGQYSRFRDASPMALAEIARRRAEEQPIAKSRRLT